MTNSTKLQKDIEYILHELTGENLNDQDLEILNKKLTRHFFLVIMDVLTANLAPEQVERLRSQLTDDDTATYETITKMSAKVPGLGEKIETAVANEFMVLKSAYATLARPNPDPK